MAVYKHHPDQHFGGHTWAQHGDDLMIVNLLTLMGIVNSIISPGAVYLDVGAHHPVNISNTKLLFSMGHRGINVDASVEAIDAFKIHRPGDVSLQFGVGPENKDEVPFYRYSPTSGRNTLSEGETHVYHLESGRTVKDTVFVNVRTVNHIVNLVNNGVFPPLLSCDIEGYDYIVLKTADFSRSSPLLVVVETRRRDTEKMRQMMDEKGFFLYCRMGENLFFIKNEYRTKVY